MSAGTGQLVVPAAWVRGFIQKPFTITSWLEHVRQALT
jgi:hypothetical protein